MKQLLSLLQTIVPSLLMFGVVTGLVGCGGGMSSVSGTVTVDKVAVEGGPETYGTVTFHPESGSGSQAVGIIGSSGHYSVMTGSQAGMQPGAYLVAVSVKKIHPAANPEGLTRPERLTPPKYADPKRSGFRVEVEPGSNTFDFDLLSK